MDRYDNIVLYCFRLVNGQLRLCETWLSRYTLSSTFAVYKDAVKGTHTCARANEHKHKRGDTTTNLFIEQNWIASVYVCFLLTKLRNKFFFFHLDFPMFDNCILLCLFFFYAKKKPQLIGKMLKLKFRRDKENKTTTIMATTANNMKIIIDFTCVPFYISKLISMCFWNFSVISSRFFGIFDFVSKLFLMKTLLLVIVRGFSRLLLLFCFQLLFGVNKMCGIEWEHRH